MSYRTQCNYCSMRQIRADAKRLGKRVVTNPDPFGTFSDGIRVHMLARGEAATEENFVAWFAELSESCCC